MIFRWSVWGDASLLLELLRHSVGTFHRWFGSSARYVVCAEQPGVVESLFNGFVEVIYMQGSAFQISAVAPWRKWAPAVRLFPGMTEFYVDCDVFAVGDPYELRTFADQSGDAYISMRESRPEAFYGLFQEVVPQGLPPINAGLVGQQSKADLSEDLMRAFAWWRERVNSDIGQYHDEQGAVAASLASHFLNGRLGILPSERYRIVSPRTNWRLEDLSGVAVIHTTWPSHPAFGRFKKLILANSTFG